MSNNLYHNIILEIRKKVAGQIQCGLNSIKKIAKKNKRALRNIKKRLRLLKVKGRIKNYRTFIKIKKFIKNNKTLRWIEEKLEPILKRLPKKTQQSCRSGLKRINRMNNIKKVAIISTLAILWAIPFALVTSAVLAILIIETSAIYKSQR